MSLSYVQFPDETDHKYPQYQLGNKYSVHFQLYTLRKLNQGDAADPRAPLGGNFRPIQPLNGRTIRTNIFMAPATNSANKVY